MNAPVNARPDRIVVVDDDARIRDLLRRYLTQEGFEVLLAEDAKAGKRIFALIRAEWERTQAALTLITGETQRLQSNPALARSIEHRFPYLDPLNHLQVELLHRFRSGQTDVRTQRAIHLTINGLAAGLRNSG